MDTYVDFTGRVTGFAVVNLADEMGGYNWRLSAKNVWKVEQMLIDYPHKKLGMSNQRYRTLLAQVQGVPRRSRRQEAGALLPGA